MVLQPTASAFRTGKGFSRDKLSAFVLDRRDGTMFAQEHLGQIRWFTTSGLWHPVSLAESTNSERMRANWLVKSDADDTTNLVLTGAKG